LVVDQGFEPCRSSPSDQSPRFISASRAPAPSTMCLLYAGRGDMSTVIFKSCVCIKAKRPMLRELLQRQLLPV